MNTNKIANQQIQELTDALCNCVFPTQSEIRQAMALAYAVGRNDGSLETSTRLLDAELRHG